MLDSGELRWILAMGMMMMMMVVVGIYDGRKLGNLRWVFGNSTFKSNSRDRQVSGAFDGFMSILYSK